MPSVLTGVKGLLSLIVVIVFVSGTLVWLGSDDAPGPSGGDSSGDLPGGNGEGNSGDDGSNGGSAGNGGSGATDGSPSGSGSDGAGGSGTGADGSDDGPGGSGGGAGGSGTPEFPPPPPGGMCGPHEFLGGLIPFVNGLGDPNLLDRPQWLENLSDFADFLPFDTGPIAGPFLGALGTPATVVGGFNEAYGMIADELPEECSMIGGDPHIVTHDRRLYDFQAVGEYWAFRSDDDSFGVQIRTMPYQSSGRASSVAGVAAQIDGQVLVIDATADNLVTLDGEPLDVASGEYTDNGGGIFYLDDGVAAYWPDSQTTMTVTSLDRPILSLHFTIGEALHERVAGLMGNADGNRSNDIALADGTSVDDGFESIHGAFRDAWRVSSGDNWFEGPSVFRDDYPTEEALLTSQEQEAARDVCVNAGVISGSLLENCMYDVAVAEEEALAEVHANNQRQRISLIDTSCELELSGADPIMEGFGPARLWQTAAPMGLQTEPAWRLTLEDGDEPNVSRAVVFGGVAIVVDEENGIHFVDDGGSIRQTLALAVIPDVAPLVVGESFFVATEEGLAGVGIDGSVCWHLLTHADEKFATLAMAGGKIIATTEADDADVSLALAMDPATGRILWDTPLQANVRQFGAGVPPALTDETGYFESAGGRVVALRLEDGEPLWTYEPQRRSNAINGLSLTAAGVIVASRSDGISLLAAESGVTLWQIASEVGVPRALAVGDLHAVVVGEQGTKAVLLANGETSWINEEPRVRGGTDPQPVISQGIVYAYAPDRQLIGLNVESGEELARLDGKLGQGDTSPYQEFASYPIMLGDVLLTINLSGDLEAFR